MRIKSARSSLLAALCELVSVVAHSVSVAAIPGLCAVFLYKVSAALSFSLAVAGSSAASNLSKRARLSAVFCPDAFKASLYSVVHFCWLLFLPAQLSFSF